MKAVLAIFSGTFKEGARSRLFWGILIFAIVMLLSSLVLSEFTFAERYKIVADFGLSFIAFFGIVVAIFVGAELIHRELDKRTIYVILSKPIERSVFVWGRYLGLIGVILINFLMMGIFLYLMIYFYAGSINALVMIAIYGSLLEAAMITAFAIFYSSFTSPFVAAFAAFGTYIICESIDIIRASAAKQSGVIRWILNFTATVFPDMTRFNLKTPAVYLDSIPASDILFITLYAAGYILILIVLTSFIFDKREFK